MTVTGVEVDFVVTDSLAALRLYEKIFEVERLEVTGFPRGQNEAIFTIYGARFHILDENPAFQLVAPKQGAPKSMWLNVLVPDIEAVHQNALDAGCTEVQPVTEMADFGVSNSLFLDPFGYVWMLHRIHREVSFEDRVKMWESRSEA
jgi:PhnB protein